MAFYTKPPVPLPWLMAVLTNAALLATAATILPNSPVSLHVQSNIPNSAIVLQLTSSDPLNGTASTSAAFCDVQADGLAPLGGGPPSPADYSTACSCNALVSSHATLTNTTVVGPGFTETETATAVIDNYLPPQDCCIKCWISAADVQVFYWPIETGPSTPPNATARVINSTVAAPAPTPYSMVSDGITFISPSVYVAYRSLRAADVCPSFGNSFVRGRTYNTTIAYAPEVLSTSICTGLAEGFYRGYAPINYTQLQFPASLNGTCEQIIGSGETSSNGAFLSLPTDLSLVDPTWHTCTAVYEGAFDPPSALKKASALISTDAGQAPSPAASPGSPVGPAHAPATATPPPKNPGMNPAKSIAPANESQDPGNQNSAVPNSGQGSSGGGSGSESKNGDPGTDSGSNQGGSNPDGSNQGGSNSGGSNQGGNDQGGSIGSTNDSPADSVPILPSIGGQQIQTASGGGVVVADNTLKPGVQTTIDNTPLSVGTSHIVVSSSTIPLAAPAIVTLVNGAEVRAGGSAAIVSGTTVALAPDGNALVINGKTSPISTAPKSVFNVAGQIVTAGSTGFGLGGQAVSPGGPAVTYSGTVVSLASDSNALVINGNTTPLPPASQSIFTVAGGQAITPGPSGFAIGGQTVLPGGPAVTYAGSTFSLASGVSGNTALVINGKTTPLPSPTQSVFTLAGQTITPGPTGFSIGGQIVLPGGPAVTFSGITFSLAPGDNALIVNGNTTPLPSPTNSVFTVGGQTFTASPTGFTIGGQSVLPVGSAVVIAGTTISLGSAGLEIGSQTVPLGSASQTTGGDMGRLIMGGLGLANGSGVVPFTGGAGKLGSFLASVCAGFGVVLGMGLIIQT